MKIVLFIALLLCSSSANAVMCTEEIVEVINTPKRRSNFQDFRDMQLVHVGAELNS